MELLIALAIALGINIVMFVPAYVWRTDKLTDVSYALTFAAVAGIVFIIGDPAWPGALLLAAIVLWAVRLGGYLLIRIHKMGRDTRFDEMRGSFVRFGQFWLLQGLTVWAVLIPSTLFLARAPEIVPAWAFLGLLVWAAGLAIETIADMQKFRFILDERNRGKWIDSGLWRYSRHPNYFGEILVWVGLYVFALGGLSGIWAVVGIIGPAYIAATILFVSGVPILERSADERWGDDPAYREYKRRTSVLIPIPGKRA